MRRSAGDRVLEHPADVVGGAAQLHRSSAVLAAERAEPNRRLDWLEQHGHGTDTETVIENMKAELHGDSLDRVYAAHTRRTRTTIR